MRPDMTVLRILSVLACLAGALVLPLGCGQPGEGPADSRAPYGDDDQGDDDDQDDDNDTDDDADNDDADDDDDTSPSLPLVEFFFTDPVSGQFNDLGQGTFTVTGHVAVEGGTIQSLRVVGEGNAREATIDGETFTATNVVVDPTERFQEIKGILEVQTADGEVRYRDRCILIGAEYHDVNATLPDTGNGRVNERAIDRVETRINQQLNQIDLYALLEDQNPIYQYSDLIVHVQVNATSADYEQIAVNIDPTIWRVLVTGIVYGVRIDVEATIDWFAAGRARTSVVTGWVDIDWIDMASVLEMYAQAGRVVTAVDEFGFTMHGFELHIDGFPDFLTELFAGSVQGMLEDAMEAPLQQIIAAAMTEFLGGFYLAREDFPYTVELPAQTVEPDEDGILVWMSGKYLTDFVDPAAPPVFGSLATPSEVPRLGPMIPGTSQPCGIALALSDDLLNQAMATTTRAGGMTHVLSGQVDLGGQTVPLDAEHMAAYLPGLSVLPPETPIGLRLSPTVPPIVTPVAGSRLLLVGLHNFHLAVLAGEGTDAATVLVLSVDAELQGTPDVTGDGGSLTLDLAPTAMETTILNRRIAVDTGDADDFAALAIERAFPWIAAAFEEIPLPAFGGFTLIPLDFQVVGDGNDFLALFGDLEPVH